MRPDADPCERMELHGAPQIVGDEIDDAPLVHDPRSDVASLHKVAQPLRRKRIEFVVQRYHLC